MKFEYLYTFKEWKEVWKFYDFWNYPISSLAFFTLQTIAIPFVIISEMIILKRKIWKK